jgi:hypothetical protein
MVGRTKRKQLAPRRSVGPEKTLVVTDDIPAKPVLTARELSVIECYLGELLAELFQHDSPIE